MFSISDTLNGNDMATVHKHERSKTCIDSPVVDSPVDSVATGAIHSAGPAATFRAAILGACKALRAQIVQKGRSGIHRVAVQFDPSAVEVENEGRTPGACER